MRKVTKVIGFILGGWLVAAIGAGFGIGKAVRMADEIELGDVDDV